LLRHIEDTRRCNLLRCFLHACSGARTLAALLRPLPRVTDTVTRGLTPQRHAFTLSLVSHAHLLAPAPVCARASAPRLHCVYVDHSPRTTNRHVSPCAERAQTPHSDNAMKLAVLLISVLLLATGVEVRKPSKECLKSCGKDKECLKGCCYKRCLNMCRMTSEACEKKCCKTCFKDKKSTRSPGRSASRARRTKVADLKSREVTTLWSANRPHRPHRPHRLGGVGARSLLTVTAWGSMWGTLLTLFLGVGVQGAASPSSRTSSLAQSLPCVSSLPY